MWYYIKKHKAWCLLTCILYILFTFVSTLGTVILVDVFQSIIDLNFTHFVFWLTAEALALAATAVIGGVCTWAQSKTNWSLNNDIRRDMVATLLSKNHREFHEKQSGEYISWLTNDVKYIEGWGWESLFDLVGTIFKVAFSAFALAKMHWSLLLVAALAACLIITSPQLFKKKQEALSEALSAGQSQATSQLKDLLLGFDIFRSFGMTKRFVEGAQAVSDQIELPKHRHTYIGTWYYKAITGVNILCQISVMLLIGFLSVKGAISQASLMAGTSLCGSIYNGLAGIGQLRLAILSTKPYFEKITVHADASDRSSNAESLPFRDAIRIEELGFSYGENTILENTSLRFEKGGKYAIVGPSGCGKSTLLKLLLGWLPEYSGAIYFDETNAKELTSDQLQQQMSYIEQDVFLFNTTIRDNITLGEDFSDELMEQAIKGSALDRDLANMPLGLDTVVGEDGSKLSGGQKQRVAIARALIHKRSILLVDEGTSALDKQNADIVEESLLNNPDLTLILVSHHLSPERKAQFTKVIELTPATVH